MPRFTTRSLQRLHFNSVDWLWSQSVSTHKCFQSHTCIFSQLLKTEVVTFSAWNCPDWLCSQWDEPSENGTLCNVLMYTFPKMKRVISFLAALGKTQMKLMRVWLKNSANMCVYTTLHSISKTARWLQIPNKNVPQIWSAFLGYGWIRIRVTHLSLMSPLHLQRAQVQTFVYQICSSFLQWLLEVAQLSQSWRRRSGCSQNT